MSLHLSRLLCFLWSNQGGCVFPLMISWMHSVFLFFIFFLNQIFWITTSKSTFALKCCAAFIDRIDALLSGGHKQAFLFVWAGEALNAPWQFLVFTTPSRGSGLQSKGICIPSVWEAARFCVNSHTRGFSGRWSYSLLWVAGSGSSSSGSSEPLRRRSWKESVLPGRRRELSSEVLYKWVERKQEDSLFAKPVSPFWSKEDL